LTGGAVTLDVVAGVYVAVGARNAHSTTNSSLLPNSTSSSGTGDSALLQSQPQVAGAASSHGWHTLQLLPGEAVVGVSVCAGGYVERLVLHTSTGRVWGPPMGYEMTCTLDYEEWAPQGGYLVGLQVGAMGPVGHAC
jgi:hypothetical protein